MHIALSVLVGTVIGIPLAIILVMIRQRSFRKNFPADGRKEQLISAIEKMKNEGRNYKDRLAYLQGQGLHKDVADVLLGEAERARQ